MTVVQAGTVMLRVLLRKRRKKKEKDPFRVEDSEALDSAGRDWSVQPRLPPAFLGAGLVNTVA